MTQKMLCKEMEKQGYPIDRTTLSKYETGSHTFPCEFLVELAKFFGTTTDYILSLTDEK